MPQILKNRCNFTVRWLLDLGNTSLEQSLRSKTLGYLFLITALSLLFGCPMSNVWLLPRKQSHSLNANHCIWATYFGPKVTGRGWISTPNWVPSGLCSNCHNPISYTPQIAENTLSRLSHSFYKMWSCPKYPKQLQLDNVVTFRLA